MDKEAEVAQLRKLDFRTGGNALIELYDMVDAVLKAVGLDDPDKIADGHFSIAMVALELAVVKGFANKARSLEHFANGMDLVQQHLTVKAKQVLIAALKGAL